MLSKIERRGAGERSEAAAPTRVGKSRRAARSAGRGGDPGPSREAGGVEVHPLSTYIRGGVNLGEGVLTLGRGGGVIALFVSILFPTSFIDPPLTV